MLILVTFYVCTAFYIIVITTKSLGEMFDKNKKSFLRTMLIAKIAPDLFLVDVFTKQSIEISYFIYM